ncbi:MAG: chemotaxis protein CheW [Syntrophobacteraceae bacterium]|nr:chemotaxis protein CheW [Syntrophobacteraceae bacterium]
MSSRRKEGSAGHGGPVDWAEIRGRLERTRLLLEEETDGNAQALESILKSRAKLLARQPVKDKPPGIHIEVVEFMVADEKYALESKYIREVYPLKELTPLPCTPSFVRGIVNVRGRILSVVDIKRFFDLPEKGLSDLNRIIILHAPEMEFGILADVVVGVSLIPQEEIQPSLPTLSGIRLEYLKGITRDGTVVLDAGKILQDPKIRVHEEVDF